MSPRDDDERTKFPFGDSDEGSMFGGLDSEGGQPISGLDSDEGFLAGLESEDLEVIEDSAASSPPLPDLSSGRVLPQRGPRDKTIPPKYPKGSRDKTIPPKYPKGSRDKTIPPKYPKGSRDKTIPPKYPAKAKQTQPPMYPTGQQGQPTQPPSYPAQAKQTRPPMYPIGQQGQPTQPPRYPDKATVPPLYPAPLAEEEVTAGAGYGAAAGDNEPTVAPGYRRPTREEKATTPPAYLSRQAERTELDYTDNDAAGTQLDYASNDAAGTVLDAGGTVLDAEGTVLDAGGLVPDQRDAARTAMDYASSDGVMIDRTAPTDMGQVPILDPGGSSGDRPGYAPTGQRDPFESSKGLDTVSGWGDPSLPYQPAMRRPGSRAGSRTGSRAGSGMGSRADSRASQIEARLLQTMELDADEMTGQRDAWDDLVFEAFESHGETPIIIPHSDMGPVFGVDSDSMIGEIPMPSDAGPLTPTEVLPAIVPATPEVAAARATAMDRLTGLWVGDAMWVMLSLAGFLLGPILIIAAWDYYGLDRQARPDHVWDTQLKASGGMGLWFGICGSILFLLNLTYVLRRRFMVLAKWVSLRLWLNMHFVFGLTGGSMILIHSAMQAGNLVARVSSAAIAVAIFSGVFGRYVLSHVPRREEGETANRMELAVYLAQLRGDLRRKLGPYPKLRTVALQALAASAPPKKRRGGGGLGMIPALILGDLKAFGRRRKFTNQLRKLLRKEAKGGDAELERLIDETLEMVRIHGRLGTRLSQYESVQDLMDSWRALHMILALIMVVTMALHVVIVLTYGNVL